MALPLLHILWDESHIWGLIAARAARAMQLPHRLVRARDVAHGLLTRERPSLLLVPGGNARLKAAKLGHAGLEAVRGYVESGGHYLGFCGGAGLALPWSGGQGMPGGLGICHWERGAFNDRMQHFMSGHMHVALPGNAAAATGLIPGLVPGGMEEFPRLPIWWPGRFSEKAREGITVLAAYERPAEDFWLADLPVAELPADAFSAWQDMYGLSFTPDYLTGQPCILYGRHGRGGYLLSYSHLETPGSPQANQWLAHIFRTLGGLAPAIDTLPPWLTEESAPWDDSDLARMDGQIRGVLETGIRHGLLFARTSWLVGWRYGLPGANLNNIWGALRVIREHEPTPAALAFWQERREALAPAVELFAKGCVQYLLAERLAMTLAKPLPEALPQGMLKDQRESLFGPPMHAGGLYKEIMEPLDELAFLQLNGKA